MSGRPRGFTRFTIFTPGARSPLNARVRTGATREDRKIGEAREAREDREVWTESDVINFWQEAGRGAAREFGRRHYKTFAAAAVLRRTWPALLALIALAALAGVALAVEHAHPGALPALARYARAAAELAAAAGAAIAARLAWRRWGLVLGMYIPAAHPAAVAALAGAALALGAGTAVWAAT